MAENNTATSTDSVILLLSNNLDTSIQFQDDLTREGFEVEAVDDFAEILIRLNEKMRYQSILLDFEYSKHDVFDVCQKIKRQPGLKYIPLIAVVHSSRKVDQLLAFEMGVDDFIYRPATQLEIQLKMRSVRRINELHTQLQQKDSQLSNLKNMQRVMVTLNHYINNALTPLYFAVQMMEEQASEDSERVRSIAAETVEFISKVLQSLNKLVSRGQMKVIQDGVYKDIMFDIETELNRLLEKTREK